MEKKKRKRKMMTISKDNKWVVLSLFKLKDDKLFHRGCGTFQSFIKFIRKVKRIIKCTKVKVRAYQGGRLVFLSFDWTFCKLSQLCEPTFMMALSHFLYPKVGWNNEASYLAMFGKGERKKERRCERKGKKKKREKKNK